MTSFYNIAKEREVFKASDKPDIFLTHASMWAGIYKRSFLNNNHIRNIETPSATYTDFTWRAMVYAYADRITIFHEALYYYTYDNPNSSWQQDGERCLYKPFHCVKANRILRDAGIFEKVKEEIGRQEFRTCFVHVSRIAPSLRNIYFDKYREVLADVSKDGFKFNRFTEREKFLAKLILTGKRELFYKIVCTETKIKFMIYKNKTFSSIWHMLKKY